MSRKVIIIEDDPDIGSLVKLHLEDIQCDPELFSSGIEGLKRAKEDDVDLLILDINLPDLDGLSICSTLRARKPQLPILMLTAKSGEVDRVVGLEIGADDYLSKPFSVPELLARVKALFRRIDSYKAENETGEQQGTLDRGDLVIDKARHQVKIKGEVIELTAKEFELLLLFASNPGKVYDRSQLLDQVWGYNHAGYEHTVNTHINRLRTKIERDPAKPEYIQTVWGVGYKFRE